MSDPQETTTAAPLESPEPSRRPRWLMRLWRGFVVIWKRPRPTTNGSIAIAALVALTAAVFTYSGFQASNWTVCKNQAVARVATRGDIRDVLFHFANGFKVILPNEPLADVYAQNQIDFVNAHYGELELADVVRACGSEPWLA